MVQNEITVAAKQLREFTRDVFMKVGMPEKDAETEAEVLVWANLRGVDSHGVLRIPWYVENVDKGQMNPRPNIKIEKETAATLLVEADRAFGPVATVFTMEKVIKKAGEAGMAWAIIRNVTHQGAMGYYSLMAAEQGMAGIAIVCSPPNTAPQGARVAGVHNSPIAISVPADRQLPLTLDMATSVVAGGKLSLARDKGQDIPAGWAIDSEGKPTTKPFIGAVLLPMAGPKGSGLAMMFECLSSIMVGNPLLVPVLAGERPRSHHIQNSIVAAIDISTFTDLDTYKKDIDRLIEMEKALPKADGVQEIMVPGEPENRVFQERSKNGIPLPGGTVKNLREIAGRFDLTAPC